MTSSNKSPQESESSENGESLSAAQAAKAPRRRVTRVAAAPTAKPVTFLSAEPALKAPVAKQPALDVDQEKPAQASPQSEEPAPTARRSRRATSAAGAPKAHKAPDSEPQNSTQPLLDLPEPQADKPARKSASRTPKQPPAELDVFAEVAALTTKKQGRAPQAERSAPVVSTDAVDQAINLDAVSEDHEAQLAKSTQPRGSGRASSKAKTARNQKTPAQDASAAPEQDEKNTESRRTRTRSTQVFMDPRNQTPSQAPAAQAPQKPRLATTALLFQAPDLNQAVVIPASPVVEEDKEKETASAPSRPTQHGGNSANTGAKRSTRSRSDQGAAPAEEPREPAKAKLARTAAPQAQEDTASGAPTDAQDDAAQVAAGQEPEATDSDTDGDSSSTPRRRRRRGGRGRGNRSTSENGDNGDHDDSDDEDAAEEGTTTDSAVHDEPVENNASNESETQDPQDQEGDDNAEDSEEYSSSRRRRRRRRGTRPGEDDTAAAGPRSRNVNDEVTALKGSTRLEAKRQRRREGRDAGRRRSIITEAEFLARRESVERSMIVRERDGRTQIAVLEDGVLVEHYVSQQQQASMAGNVYLGRVQNVLPSMEAAFIDVGKGRNAVLYAGEVNWDASGLDGQPRRIEEALKSGDTVLVQVTKDPIGHKGARLTSQVTLAGRYLVFVPGGGMTGISRKLPDTERARLKRVLKEIVPEGTGVIVRTAAEGASEEELTADIARLQAQWDGIQKKAKTVIAPSLLQGEPDLAIRVVRDIFNDDFSSLQVQGDGAWNEISGYVQELAPDLADRVTHWVSEKDIFAQARVDEQLAKGMDRKVWLPSGGSLVIDRTEAMTVIDVNTGKFTGAGGTLEETVTRNNLESAEEIVRQLRLRDIGGIIVIDFIDMVLESNRDLVLRRLVECLGRDRTKHQVAEVTSLGLVQMTRKRVGQGLVEAFSTTCEHCNGRGFIVHEEPNERQGAQGAQATNQADQSDSKRPKRKRAAKETETQTDSNAVAHLDSDEQTREAVKATLATIAASAGGSQDERADSDSTEIAVDQDQGDPTQVTKPARKNGRAPRKNAAKAPSKGSNGDKNSGTDKEDSRNSKTSDDSSAGEDVTEVNSDKGSAANNPSGAKKTGARSTGGSKRSGSKGAKSKAAPDGASGTEQGDASPAGPTPDLD